MQEPVQWWGNFDILTGKNVVWDFGSLLLDIGRETSEWLVRYHHTPVDAEQETESVVIGDGERAFPDNVNVTRHIFNKTDPTINVLPVLPDRNLVVRPVQTVMLMPGQKITFYVSTPVWLRIQSADGQHILRELPVRTLSDTWFGPSSRVGEMCYASRTKALIEKEAVAIRPHRVIIPIRVKNHLDQPATIERMNVPLLHLNLYRNAQGQFWSTAVSITTDKGNNSVKLQVHDRLNQDDGFQLVSEARKPVSNGLVNKAYDLLFS